MTGDATHSDDQESAGRRLTDGLAARTVPTRRVLVWGGTLVTHDGEHAADLLIENGRIAEVRPRRPGPVPEEPAAGEVPAETFVIVARGKHVLPGAYDMHVHFRDPLPSNPAEDLTSGSLAAAAGGVCGFADMPNTAPMVTTPQRWQAKMELAAAKARVDYSFFPAVSAAADERATLAAFDRTRIPGFKLFMGGTTQAEALDDAALDAGFAAAAALDVPAVVHAEDDARIAANLERFRHELQDPSVHARIRDAEACLLCTKRAVALAAKHGAHLHVAHLTSSLEVDYLREVRAAGRVHVTAEATLHHLLFDDRDYAPLGHKLKCNPSVKGPADRAALWDGLRDGTISFVATDHAPHTLAAKARPYLEAPSGVPGTEMVLPALLNEVHAGRATMPEVVRWTSWNVASHYALRGKGRVERGYDADFVIVDITRRRTVEPAMVRTGAGYLPWEGRTMHGWPLLTLLRGRPVFADATPPPSDAAEPLRFR